MSRRWRYRCRTCGEHLASWAAAERHGDAHHGARLELLGIGESCEHPLDAALWDKHRALLRCTACGRDVEKSLESPVPITPLPSILRSQSPGGD